MMFKLHTDDIVDTGHINFLGKIIIHSKLCEMYMIVNGANICVYSADTKALEKDRNAIEKILMK